MIRECIKQLTKYQLSDYAKWQSNKKLKLLCAVVLGFDDKDIPRDKLLSMRVDATSKNVDLKFYSLSHLFSKYGMPGDSTGGLETDNT